MGTFAASGLVCSIPQNSEVQYSEWKVTRIGFAIIASEKRLLLSFGSEMACHDEGDSGTACIGPGALMLVSRAFCDLVTLVTLWPRVLDPKSLYGK
jgi:hypothetical protein